MLAIPLIYWSIYGSGQGADSIEKIPVHIFIENWGALLVTILLCVIAIIYNNKKGNIGYAKSYLFTIIIISILYIFRIPIIDFFIGI